MTRRKKISLKVKLIATFSMIVVISLLIQLSVSYFFFGDAVIQKTIANFQQIITQTNKGIDATLYSYEKMTQNVIVSDAIQENLRAIQSGEVSYESASQSIQDALSVITLSEESINSIQIIPKDKKTINYIFSSNYVDFMLLNSTSYESIKETVWYDAVKDTKGQIVWLSEILRPKIKKYGMQTRVFSAFRKINDLDTGQELAYLLVNVDERKIHHVMKDLQLGDNSQVYLVDENKRIISNKDTELIGNYFDIESVDLTKYIIVRDKSEETNWEIISVIPKDEYKRELRTFNTMFIYLALIAILAITVLSYSISKGVTAPINVLIKGMDKVKRGKFDTIIEVKQENELGELADHFNKMAQELNFFVKKVYVQELNRREVELKAVQAQLNPHFLYNTLDTIYWKLVLDGNEKVGDLVVSLSEILRYSINSDTEFVSVEEDAQQINNYLQIQKSRFEDQIQFEVDIDPDILNYKIPKLIIQPLVENAIIHGFKNFDQKGHVTVLGYKDQNALFFEVIDDGVGMSEETIQCVLSKAPNQKEKSGFGIDVVNKRIKILYGDDYGIHIKSNINEGTRMTVKLDLYIHRR